MKAERISLAAVLDSTGTGGRLEEIAGLIEHNAVFVYPTETIYGIGGRSDSPAVASRIFRAKRRPPDHPMILVAAERSAFESLRLIWPPAALLLAQQFWPGLLTLVLPAADGTTCAVRVSPHPFLRALGSFLTFPLFSTSANISGASYLNDPDAIYGQFMESVDFMIDAGPLPPSPPSTLVRVSPDDTVTVLREGAIDALLIQETLHKR